MHKRRRFAKTSLPPAVVIGLDSITGLQTARVLARYGIPVIALAKDLKHYCCRTNVTRHKVRADDASEDLIDRLEELGRELPQEAVLFPCTDMSVLRIVRHAPRLLRRFRFEAPDAETVAMLMDKARFQRHVERLGLCVPRAFELTCRADAAAAAAQVRFPCVLKPALKDHRWTRFGLDKAYKIDTAGELRRRYDRCSAASDTFILQEWIDGPETDLYTCNAYFDAASRPLVTWVSQKIRQWPPHVGTACLSIESRNDDVVDQTLRLFQSVGFHGLAYAEMKWYARTGQHYFIEANVGRPTGRSASADAAGVELLYTKYCDNLGLPLPKNHQQEYRGVKWRHKRRDLQWAWHAWRRGEITWREWWRSCRGPTHYPVYDRHDLGPWLAEMRHLCRRLSRRKHDDANGQDQQRQDPTRRPARDTLVSSEGRS